LKQAFLYYKRIKLSVMRGTKKIPPTSLRAPEGEAISSSYGIATLPSVARNDYITAFIALLLVNVHIGFVGAYGFFDFIPQPASPRAKEILLDFVDISELICRYQSSFQLFPLPE